MSFLRFNHVFLGLMALSFLSAVISPRFGGTPKMNVQALFAPVAVPARGVVSMVTGMFSEEQLPADAASPDKPRPLAQIREENTQLRLTVIELTKQLEYLQILNADREKLGLLRQLCTPVAVVGTDAGTRQTLQLQGSSERAVQRDMAVLYSGGLVGRISSAGVGGAEVRLITDEGFAMTCGFGRIVDGKFLSLPLTQQLVRGAGRGRMLAPYIKLDDIKQAGLAENDSVVLEDRDWPQQVWGQNVGRIVRIVPRRNAPGYADVEIEPFANLLQLKEVMVLTR